MEVKPLNSMGSLQPWLQVVRAVNPSASSQVTRKPCFEYDSVLLFENSSIDRVVPPVVSPIYKPFSPFGRGKTLLRGLTNHGY